MNFQSEVAKLEAQLANVKARMSGTPAVHLPDGVAGVLKKTLVVIGGFVSGLAGDAPQFVGAELAFLEGPVAKMFDIPSGIIEWAKSRNTQIEQIADPWTAAELTLLGARIATAMDGLGSVTGKSLVAPPQTPAKSDEDPPQTSPD